MNLFFYFSSISCNDLIGYHYMLVIIVGGGSGTLMEWVDDG